MNERMPLDEGFVLKTSDGSFTIGTVIGTGGSSIVYNAEYLDESGLQHFVRLKELFPSKSRYHRNADGSIVKDANSEKIEKRFIDAALLQTILRREQSLVNSTFEIRHIIEANGTLYSVMEYLKGICLLNVSFTNIKDCLAVLRQLTECVAVYHSRGYLHLDIKPENIYCIKTVDGIKTVLFDFDSVIKEELLDDTDFSIISSKGYSAPEISDRRRISRRTDFFFNWRCTL